MSNNKKIAKNTIYLYIRTLVVLLVMLYTSRIVLEALGAENLGIYNVIGGIVALMSFFQVTLTKATSRFLTFDLGRDEGQNRLARIFSIAMTIHLIIVVVALLLGETVGLFILENWTSIPENKHDSAFFVYQFSLAVFCIHILRVPYDAVIVAHEKMSIYAYMSILEAALNLGLSFLVLHIPCNKLILYSGLLLLVASTIFLCFYVYVRKYFSYFQFHFIWDKQQSKSILLFSSWSLLGTSTNAATQQGVSLLFNNFVGLIANTALGFANQVNGAVGRFVCNFTTAFNPQLIKLCAQQNYSELFVLMNRASKFSFVLIWVMSLPLIINMDYVLHIWLGNVPIYTSEFCQMILICSVIDSITGVYNTAITATGSIKNYQILISISFILDLLFAFLLLKLNFHPVFVFGSRILTRGIFNMFIGWYFVYRLLGFNIPNHLKNVFIPVLLTVVLSLSLEFLITIYFIDFERLITTILLNLIVVPLCTFYLIMSKQERLSVVKMLKKYI